MILLLNDHKMLCNAFKPVWYCFEYFRSTVIYLRRGIMSVEIVYLRSDNHRGFIRYARIFERGSTVIVGASVSLSIYELCRVLRSIGRNIRGHGVANQRRIKRGSERRLALVKTDETVKVYHCRTVHDQRAKSALCQDEIRRKGVAILRVDATSNESN